MYLLEHFIASTDKVFFKRLFCQLNLITENNTTEKKKKSTNSLTIPLIKMKNIPKFTGKL